MPRLSTGRNWGDANYNNNPLLVRQLDDMYRDISVAYDDTVKKRVVQSSDPPSNSEENANFNAGDIWVRQDNNTAWILTSRANANEATWTLIT